MGVRYLTTHAVLEGVVAVEDAETLLQWLLGREEATVALERCEHLHAAALQVLLAVRPRMVGVPADPGLARALGRNAEDRP